MSLLSPSTATRVLSALLLAMTTVAPIFSSPRHVSNPRPLLHPVTMNTLPNRGGDMMHLCQIQSWEIDASGQLRMKVCVGNMKRSRYELCYFLLFFG